MGFDAITQVQARIDAIQQRFVALGVDGAPATGASTPGATTATPASNDAFAAALAQATATQQGALGFGAGSTGGSSGGDGLTGMLASLTGGASGSLATSGGTLDTSSLLNALAGQITRAAGATTTGTATGTGTVNGFLADALRQSGKAYRYGAVASPADPSPAAFDCSELVQWAAAREGIRLPRTAGQQYVAAKQAGELVPVEQALRTPGALLFSFSTEPQPGGAEPAHAHVAISLGDGRTIEARGRAYGVGTWSAAHRFTYGAILGGLAR